MLGGAQAPVFCYSFPGDAKVQPRLRITVRGLEPRAAVTDHHHLVFPRLFHPREREVMKVCQSHDMVGKEGYAVAA